MDGWSLSGIFNWHSGFPWTPIYTNIDGNNICSITFTTPVAERRMARSSSSVRDLRRGGDQLVHQHVRKTERELYGDHHHRWPNCGRTLLHGSPLHAMHTSPPCACPIPEPPGVGRNSFRGPRYIDVDATISKSFGLPKMKVLGEGARMEFRANVYNLFNNLNMDPTQMDNVITDPYFGNPKAALGSRSMELQARFSF